MRPRVVTASWSARLWQIVLIAMGWSIVAIGLLIAPLPGPFGLPIAAVGVAILLRNSQDARKLFVNLKRRAPKSILGRVERLIHARLPRRLHVVSPLQFIRWFDGWRHERRQRRRATRLKLPTVTFGSGDRAG